MRTVQAVKRSVDLLLSAIQFRGNQENFMKQTAKALRSMALGSAVLSIVGCVSAPVSPATIEAELMEADMAYEAFNLEYGYEAASKKFVDFDKGFMLEAGEGFLTGEAAIMAERQLDTVPSPVHWKPIGAIGSASGDMGVTWGSFSVDGDPETTGNYVTVWRKVDGVWKIVTDTAVDDPAE